MSQALLGGTGIEHLELEERRGLEQATPYGLVQAERGSLGGREIIFLSRHGKDHAVPPHLVNYRANLWALREWGVSRIIATAAVGSLAAKFRLGDLVLPDQFLDFTKSRVQTYYEGGARGVLHVDMTEPYCREIRTVIKRAGEELGIPPKDGAVYVCTEGPRFETPAEIKMFQILGGEIVGMTSVPEVVLARELGLCYATIGLVTNEAAGIAQHPLNHGEVVESMKGLGKTVARLLEKTFAFLPPQGNCKCGLGAAEAGKF